MARRECPRASQDELRRFVHEYRSYAIAELTPTLAQVGALFDRWASPAYWGANRSPMRLPLPSPIEHHWHRIKRPESVVDKIMRRPESFARGLNIESVRNMHDAVSGRIVVHFLSQLSLVHGAITRERDIEISAECPPVAYMDTEVFKRLGLSGVIQEAKDTGYSSVHYLLRFRRSASVGGERPWWELQMRTLAEHVWAQLHHMLGYKGAKKTNFAVAKTFQVIGQQLSAIDQHFNLLYEEQLRFQQETQAVANDDPLNAENLAFVLAELGTACAQREIDGLLRMLNSRGLATAGRLRKAGSIETVELVRHLFLSEKGRPATNFEIVASVAAVAGLADGSRIEDAIRTQMAFLSTWEDVRKAMRASETP